MRSASRPDLFTCRCPACGRRILGVGPAACPEHGPAPLSEPSTGVNAGERELPLAHTGAPPRFPGFRNPRLVGVGGFGVVFAVEPETGGPEVAIKLARADRPDAAIHLAHEARALSEIGPPYVPLLHACGSLPDGAPYLVMQLLRCPTLADRLLAAGGSLPASDACDLVGAALRALGALHGRGYVHRDLKPENLFIDEARRATLVDLGLATASNASPMTATSAALGTAEYMAPEQCEGRAHLDGRADIYAIGVILYELLAGRPPFWGPPASVRQDHRSRRPARLSAWAPVSPALEEVILRCLAKEPRDRWRSAAALREALERAARQPLSAPPPASSQADVGAASAHRHARRTVGLLLFDADLDVVTLQRRLIGLGGELVHAAGGRCAAVFEHEAGASPAPRALGAARELIQRGECAVALVELATVLVQRRRDGTRRFLSPLFSRDHLLPPAGPGGAPGLFITLAVAAVLPEVTLAAASTPAPPGLLQVPIHNDVVNDTTTRPLIGRASILEPLLEGALAAISDRAPTIVSVIGDTGFGKTHLAAALGKRLRELGQPIHVVELRAREPLAGGTDRTVRELLQHALELSADAPPDRGRALLRSCLGGAAAELAPAIALALGWATPPDAEHGVSPTGPSEEEYPELERLRAAPGALRSALTAAAGEALRQRAARIPLLIVLDDAHIADQATLSALEYAALAEAGAPLWICALGRPAFEEARPGWGERAARRRTFRLGPLEPESAASLCRQLLLPAEDVPEPAIRRLVDRSQAVPLLIVELVLGLKREGIVRRHPRGDAWYLATDELERLPDMPLLEWLAHGELDALPPALQEHARLVALLGAETTLAEIAGVLGRLEQQGAADALPLDAGIATERLIASGVLVRDRRRGRLAFRHALVREVVARSTPEALRRQIHRAAYEHHRHRRAGGDEARLLALAHHAAEAGFSDVAEGAYLILADRARGRHAYVEAEALYSRALEQATGPAPEPATAADRGADDGLGPPDLDPEGVGRRARRAAAHRGRGLMRYRLGRYHDTVADLACARAAASAQGDLEAEIEILLDEATALDWMDEYRSSEERVEQAKALAAGLTPLPPALGARLLLGEGRSLHRFSHEREAADALDRAAREAAPLGGAGYETLVIALLMLGFIDQGLGRLEEAGAALDRAIALCEAHRDALHLVPAINNRALLWACRGDKAHMIADLTRVLALARELGLGMLELVGEHNIGECLYLMDDSEAAAPHIERAVAIEQRRAGNAGRPVALLLEARFRLHRGDEPGARALFERILDGQRAARAEGRADALLVPSEEVLHAMVDLATRNADDADDAAWDDLISRSARCSVGQEHIEVLEARAAAAMRRARPNAARRALAQALAAAARIPNAMGDRLHRRSVELKRMEEGAPCGSR